MSVRCEKCGAELEIGMFPFCRGREVDHGPVPSKTSVFPFEARHVTPDGKPIVINDIAHLRKVEREYGVVLTAFSREKGNWDYANTQREELPRYRGDHPDNRRR